MEVLVSNVLTVSEPTEELKQWCKKHLEIPNPEYSKKARMGFWLGSTPKTLALYEKRGDKLVLPYGVLREFPFKARFKADFRPIERVSYNARQIPLYDYQKVAKDELLRAKYGILQSAAGSGKTTLALALIIALERKALWLTHTLDLVNQSKERALQFIDKDKIGTITGGKVDIGECITFATVQTMAKLDLARYKDEWDVVIVDEAHRVAGSPTSVTQFAKVLNSLAARHKYGLSATVHRADGMIEATYSLLGKVVYKVPDSAVADKIMKVGICPVGTGVQIARTCLNTDGTLNYTKLISYLTSNIERNTIIINEIVNNVEKSSLILSDRIEHLENLRGMLPTEMQKDSCLISGKMTSKKGKAEREQAIEDMRRGAKKYLFATYSLAKEGLDIPCLERLYLATPQKDYAVITQSIGRIARTSPGKDNPVCYDFVDNIGYLQRSYKKRCTTYRKNGCYFLEDS